MSACGRNASIICHLTYLTHGRALFLLPLKKSVAFTSGRKEAGPKTCFSLVWRKFTPEKGKLIYAPYFSAVSAAMARNLSSNASG